MKRLFTYLGVAALGAAFLAGCTPAKEGDQEPSTNPSTSGGTAKKDIKIVMVAKSTSNPVFLAAQTGATQAAKDITDKGDTKVSVEIRTPPEEDAQRQANAVSEAANSGADAVLISCSDAAKVTQAINEAVDKGTLVMTFDSDAPDSKRFAFYGADDMECGKRTVDELAKQTGEKGNVGILAGNQTAPNLQKRVKGAQDALKAYPNMKEVGVFYHKETPADAANEVKTAMQAHPEIDAWAMIGGWPLFTTTLLNDLDPAKVKVVAIDALPLELPYIDKGIAPVLLAQPVYDWGYKSVNLIVDKIQGKDVPVINKMELVRVSKENLGDWARQLDKWGLPDIDKKYLDMK